MIVCDVCSGPTSWDEGTGYTADEFRGMVARGFGPDKRMIQLQEAFGASRSQIIAQWKNGLVAMSTTGWLLCPSCAARASMYLYKAPGGGPSGHVLTESLPLDRLFGGSGSASGSSLAGNRLHINKKVVVGTAIVLLVLALGALLLFSASPVGKTAMQPADGPADGPAVGTPMHENRRNP